MKIFHNRDRPNYYEVVSYGPKWLTEFREMDANYQYAGWTLDLMAYWLEQMIHNVFPLFADEPTITKYEKFLGLEYDPYATLEERRKTVAAFYYFGFGKLSRSAIIKFIKDYTGCDSDVTYNGMAFFIHIDGQGLPVLVDDKFLNTISRRMPAHLGYSVQVEENTLLTEYLGYIQVVTPHIVIEMEELNKVVYAESVAVAHVMCPTIILS